MRLGIKLYDPVEMFCEDLAKGIYKTAYLDRPLPVRQAIDAEIQENRKNASLASDFGNEMFVRPAVDAVKGYGDAFMDASTGRWRSAGTKFVGATANAAMTAGNLSLGGAIGKAGFRGAGWLATRAMGTKVAPKVIGGSLLSGSMGDVTWAGRGILNTSGKQAPKLTGLRAKIQGAGKAFGIASAWGAGASVGSSLSPDSIKERDAAQVYTSDNPLDKWKIWNSSDRLFGRNERDLVHPPKPPHVN